ncbi:MAG: hypothetical protein HYV63_26455 [Candidatus Schekmanbacteria bacterium]|nr:hypothetical protein [Candidatus Schekmanbacteria bacterium]
MTTDPANDPTGPPPLPPDLDSGKRRGGSPLDGLRFAYRHGLGGLLWLRGVAGDRSRLQAMTTTAAEGMLLALVAGALLESVAAAFWRTSPARWVALAQLPVAASAGALGWFLGGGWRSISRALGTYLIVLVAALSWAFGVQEPRSFHLAGVPLAVLGNLLFAGALGYLAVGSLRRLPAPLSGIYAGFLGAMSVPFLIGAAGVWPLGKTLTAAPGFLSRLPVYLHPGGLCVLGMTLSAAVGLVLIGLGYRGGHTPLAAEHGARARVAGRVAAGAAVALGLAILWQLADQGISARYFSGPGYGRLLLERSDANIDRTWWQDAGDFPGADGAAGEPLWAEWEGELAVPATGEVSFTLAAPLGGFLYVDGLRLLDKAGTASRELARGRVSLRVAALRRAGGAADGATLSGEPGPTLSWKLPGATTAEVVPARALLARPRPGSWRRTPRQAAQVGLEWLQSAAAAWQREHNCYGCHVQAQAVMGMSIAQDNGYRVSRSTLQELVDGIVRFQRQDGSWHTNAHVAATQYGVMALATAAQRGGEARAADLLEAARYLILQQGKTGGVEMDRFEPPIDQGNVLAATNSRIGWAGAAAMANDEAEAKALREAARRAQVWLVAAPVETNQDRALRLLGLASGDSEPALATPLDTARRDLLAHQLDSGGWAEMKGMGANGFATGQALYALKVAGESIVSAPFQNGVRWLLEHQLWTGAWPAEATRSHRPSEYAPTMWAVIALAGSFEAVTVEIAAPEAGAQVQGPVSLSARVVSEEPVEAVRFSVDGSEVGTAREKDAAGLFTVPWTAAGAEGAHEIKAEARRGASVEGEARTTVYTGTVLSVAITAPANGGKVAARTGLEAEARSLRGGAVTGVRFELSGPGTAGVQALGDAAPVGPAGSDDEGRRRFALDWNPAGLAPGVYTLEAVATDGQGATARDRAFVEIVEPLAVRWIEPQGGAVLQGPTELRFRVDRAPGVELGAVELLAGDRRVEGVRDLGEGLFGATLDPGELGTRELTLSAVAHGGDGGAARADLALSLPAPLGVEILRPPGGAALAAFQPVELRVTIADTFVEHSRLIVDGAPELSWGGEAAVIWDTRKLADGPHEAVVEIRDSQGRTASAHVAVRVASARFGLRAADERGLRFAPEIAEIVLDASGSMWGKVATASGDRAHKIEIARQVLSGLLRELPDEARVAMRVYGHRQKKDCRDSELLVPMDPVGKHRASTIERIEKLNPRGMTPIAWSLEQVGADLAGERGRGVVILVSDGIETCEGNPVEAARKLLAAGLRVKVHVIGFDVAERDAVEQLIAVAEATGGRYLRATTAEELRQALDEVITVEAELLDGAGNRVAQVQVGAPPVRVPVGSYRVAVAWEPPVTLEPLELTAGQETIVRVLRTPAGLALEQ